MSDLFYDHTARLMNAANLQVRQHSEEYHPDFEQWLQDNGHIWEAFYNKCQRLKTVGREHYGSRAIIEVLRFESALLDSGEPWKINNNCTGQLARLYNAVTGSDFFDTRDRKQ